MKILFVGQLRVGQTSRMRMEALAELGHEVIPLDSQEGWLRAPWLSRQLQQRIRRGPIIDRLNREVVALADRHRPDLLWGEKQEHLRADTLASVRARGTRLLHFTPDPYFSLEWKRTRTMDEGLPQFDYVVTCKRYEEAAYRRVCARVIYMPLGFGEAVHRPLVPVDAATRRAFTSDVGFVGGWEPRRERLLDAIARTGCDVKIWGYAWDHLRDGRWTARRALRLRRLAGGERFTIARNPRLEAALQGGEIYGDRYAWALSSASISVGFLRTICPDQHTTRSFEIPACRSLLIADRTDEHCELFDEGREAEFFASEAELTDKVRFYLSHPEARDRVADAGYQRCLRSGYSYRERLQAVLRQLD
jgi:hypothetical protein